jgi:hypothetical protein
LGRRLADVEERRFRIGALVEWFLAAAAVFLVLWIASAAIQRVMGRGLHAAVVQAPLIPNTPPGVPAGATLVPVVLLLDGREVRQGDLHTRLDSVLPATLAEGPPVTSNAQFGERHTRAYRIDRSTIYIVCERTEPNGPVRVAGIYLP